MSVSAIESVSFLGLGAMGWHMASHLTNHFNDVRVWNRTESKALQHAQQFGTHAVDIEAALQADVIFSCLPTSADVEGLIASHTLSPNRIWVDCTSGEPTSAVKLSQLLRLQHIDYLDAPVSGQTIGAQNGTLTVMVGGDKDALQRAKPAIEAFSGQITHVGGSGSGFAVKAVNNMLLAVNLWSAAEGFSILKSHGVDIKGALDCINASSGKSMATESVMPQRVLNRQFPLTFALPLLVKDTRIAMDLATAAKLSTPVLTLAQNLVQASHSIQTGGSSDNDFSTLVQLLEYMNGLSLSFET